MASTTKDADTLHPLDQDSGIHAPSLLPQLIAIVVFVMSIMRSFFVLIVYDIYFKTWRNHPQGDAEGPETILFAPFKEKYIYDPKKLRSNPANPVQTFRFTAHVVDFVDNTLCVSNAVVEAWQQDPTMPGLGYHNFDYEFRGKFRADHLGKADILTLKPYPLEVPEAGTVLTRLGFQGVEGRRPSHIHFWISAPGYQPLITQVYFDDNIASFEEALMGSQAGKLIHKRRLEVLSTKVKSTSDDAEAEVAASFTFMLMKAGSGGEKKIK